MQPSYSAEGEDILIQKLLDRCFPSIPFHTGVYVDVGAHDPWENSNTAALYLRNWSGHVIDPRPGVMAKFSMARPRDCCWPYAAVGPQDMGSPVMLTIMDRPELSSCSEAHVAASKLRGANVQRGVWVYPMTLREMLSAEESVDFLNCDIEGGELEALQGFPWDRLRPKVICVEVISTSFKTFLNEPVVKYLEGLGYHLASRLHCSAVFVDGREAVWR